MQARVRNMTSPATGREVPNQFIVSVIDQGGAVDKEYFQSYSTVIAERDYATGCITLDKGALDYSNTTSKYLYHYMGGLTRKEVQQGIKSGRYLVRDLNER